MTFVALMRLWHNIKQHSPANTKHLYKMYIFFCKHDLFLKDCKQQYCHIYTRDTYRKILLNSKYNIIKCICLANVEDVGPTSCYANVLFLLGRPCLRLRFSVILCEHLHNTKKGFGHSDVFLKNTYNFNLVS